MHAALADPARLAIVDALSLGDASPTELQSLVQMSSNLLAHHLKVLETQGLVVRSRSEGDRRRTYLRMVPSALSDLLPAGLLSAPRVVFVCTQNSARSQLAAALWTRTSDVPAASAGTHPAKRIDQGALAVAARHRLPLRGRRPRPVSEVLEDGDWVVTVCDQAHEELGEIRGLHWSIPDPVPTGTDAAFDAAFADITRRVGDLAPRLTASPPKGVSP